MRWLISVALASLAGCSATGPVAVRVPVPVPCVEKLPERPAECIQRDDSRPEWLRCALVERDLLRGYAGELEAVLQACISAP